MQKNTISPAELAAYRRRLEELEKSPSTIASYMRAAGGFAGWLSGRELDRREAAAWKAALASSGLATATVNCRVAAVNGLLSFLGREDCRVKTLRRQRRLFCSEGRELRRGEYERLVRSARERGDETLAMIMETICATGIRVGELRFITVESLRCGTAEILLKGKARTVMLPTRLRAKLAKYAAKRRVHTGAVFLGRRGPLSRKTVWERMKALCAAAGVEPGKVFPHNLRHLFAREFYRASRDVAKLADVLGHSSLDTTRIYLVSTGAEHRAMLDRLRLIC